MIGEYRGFTEQKIWITTGGGIGDTIMFTPALRRLKEKYPSCHITFMTRYPNHAVLRGLSYLDEVTYFGEALFSGDGAPFHLS